MKIENPPKKKPCFLRVKHNDKSFLIEEAGLQLVDERGQRLSETRSALVQDVFGCVEGTVEFSLMSRPAPKKVSRSL